MQASAKELGSRQNEDEIIAPQLNYTPLERLRIRRPVDRIKFITSAAQDRRVLDLGAIDETAFDTKRGRGSWLHEEIAMHASRVDGIDNSILIQKQGMRTAPNAVIKQGDICDLGAVLVQIPDGPDVIVAGEIIEHLENPLAFLRQFVAINDFSGKLLILSTPNATAIHNVLIGLSGRESTHRDHLCILSFKTLSTLCSRAGFRAWEIIPYYSRFTEMKARHTGLVRLLIVGAERAVNVLEWLFPLMSFGYIVRVEL